MQGGVYMSTSKYKRRTLSIDSQFERLQTQWKNGQSGAGAWFWQHFKPVLLTVHEGTKELHLQCIHCAKLFSARNPSRTSLEHLKSGACNVFRRTPAYEEVKAVPRSFPAGRKGRKGTKNAQSPEEFGRKRMAEEIGESVRMGGARLESGLAATEALGNFFLESGIPVSLLSHPRLLEFCGLVGAVPPTPKQLLTNFLDARFTRICEENEMRMRKTGVFQIAAEGWRTGTLTIMINFQEGPPSFLKIVELRQGDGNGLLDVLGFTTEELDSVMDRRNCVGWVTDVHAKDRQAMLVAEDRYPWMIHVTCQAFAVRSLMKDLQKHAKAVSETTERVRRIVLFFHSRPADLAILRKKEPNLIFSDLKSVHPVVAGPMMIDSLWQNRIVLESVLLEEQLLSHDSDSIVAECLNAEFWETVSAVNALLHPLLVTFQDVEQTQPHFSQMMDMWLNLEAMIQEWCQRHVSMNMGVMDVFRKRFEKSYHPAMAAAYLLDPGFCVKHENNSFLPNCSRLCSDQHVDASFILKKVSAPNRCGRAAADFARWQAEGLPSEFGTVLSERTLVGESCLSKCVPMALRKTTWTSCLKEFEALGIVAHRLLSVKATATGPVSRLTDSEIPLSPAAVLTQSKLQYVRNNIRVINQRLVDERLLDLDVISELSVYPEGRSSATEIKHDAMDIDCGAVQVGDMTEGSQLYMQQLQLNSSQHVSQSVLRMIPPPLGTMPELPLQSSEDIAVTPPTQEAIVHKDEESFYMSTHTTDAEQTTSGLDPTANDTPQEVK